MTLNFTLIELPRHWKKGWGLINRTRGRELKSGEKVWTAADYTGFGCTVFSSCKNHDTLVVEMHGCGSISFNQKA